MNSIFKTFFVSLCIVANTAFAYAQTASILPPAKTTFNDQNGKPLTNGTVDFYVPGTTTRKTTWQDSAESIPNTNPVTLDGSGRALILGDGAYRQVVKDRNGNLIWDQVTSSLGTGGSGSTTIGDGLPVGSILPNSGFVAPANYQFAYGQALPRSTYANLFTALTIQASIGCVGGSPLITISDTSNLSVGTVLESICVTGSPTVVSKTSSTVTLSANSTITISTNGVFFPYGNGDALTTFNVPDLRGYVVAGRCNMGGANCSVLNSTYFSSNSNNSPSGVNAKGGSQSLAVLQANLPNIVLPVTDPGHNHVSNIVRSTSTAFTGNNDQAYVGSVSSGTTAWTSNSAVTGITVRTGGSGTPVSLLQPTVTLNYVVKVLPDSNLTSTFGVGSIGGMTGIIACGSGVTCAANTISFSFVGVNSIQGMTGDVTCGTGLTCSAGSISANGVNPQVISTRAAAAALDLSIYSVVKTLGYSTGGDGGGATFKKVGSAAFIDSSIATGTLTAGGSLYTNNTYYGVALTGGTGTGAYATITVAGGAVTTVTVTGTKGNAYTAGNVLSATAASIGGTGSGFTWTVSTVTTPTGSFTDSAGNHFQIVVDEGNFVNAKQFGAVGDWTRSGGDAPATNNFAAVQNMLQFAGYNTGGTTSDAGGSQGTTAIVPKGTYKVCVGSGTLLVPASVTLAGVGPGNTVLKMCDSDAASSHFVTLGDPASRLACFYSSIRDIELFTGSGTANANTAMIFTNCAQQAYIAKHVSVYAGQRNCLYGDIGYGGAADFNVDDFFCTLPGAFTGFNNGIQMNYGAAVANFHDIIVESGGTNQNGIYITTGSIVNIDGWHSEGVNTPIYINITGSAIARIHTASGGGGGFCSALVTRQVGSVSGATVAGGLSPNGCTNTINNAGVGTSGNVVGDVVF